MPGPTICSLFIPFSFPLYAIRRSEEKFEIPPVLKRGFIRWGMSITVFRDEEVFLLRIAGESTLRHSLIDKGSVAQGRNIVN